ncbi:transporter [Streptococcus porcinus]|uniref:Transporter n=1 Tax=Streptococcus porcinus TaxID=1340 RepID=A0A7V9WSW5_STRPO|nr:transporter [Streptococcus porcinus]MBA2796470.1 transporter [Streptococcus porcinus]
MNILTRNSVFRTITISRFLSALGSYMYNIVFIVYATTLPYSNIALFIANIVTIIPTVFTFWIGIKADNTKNKVKLLILMGFLQSILFVIIALLMKNKTFLVFSIVGFINVISDAINDFTNGLRLPIMQKNIESEKLYEAYSFSQFISYLSNILGQVLGVWLLTTSNHNYSFVAVINALTFLLSTLILLLNKQKLTYHFIKTPTEKISLSEQFKEMYATMKEIFKKVDDVSFVRLLMSILILNVIGGAVNSIYNFYFMKHQLFGLHYGQSLVIVESILIVGAILGNLTPNDYFSKLSISKLVIIQSVAFGLVGISNITKLSPIFGILFLAFAAFIMGKATPKLDSLLMENLPTNMLAQSNNFLGLLFTLSLPLGVFIFSSLAIYSIILCWILFTMLSLIAIIFIYIK